METEKKLETLEEELRLMKGEVKQSLASVRDYLLNMELPSSELATVLQALGTSGSQTITMKGSLTSEKPPAAQETPEEPPEEPVFEETREEFLEPESELPTKEEGGEEAYIEQGEPFGNRGEQPAEDRMEETEEYFEPDNYPHPRATPDEPEAKHIPEPELPMNDENQFLAGRIGSEMNQSTPRVNLLANLMHWITKAKKEIGSEQLPLFLEVYGLSGHLSHELKEAILHMAEVASEPSEKSNAAEVWSQAMLSLHGILTGGDAPLYPVKPSWGDDDSETTADDEEVAELETEKPQDTPFKLKLVIPGSDGQNREFSLDLKPEVINGSPQEGTGGQEYPDERGDAAWQQRQPRRKT